jgi:hypothetical protein
VWKKKCLFDLLGWFSLNSFLQKALITYASTHPSGFMDLPICSIDTVQLSILIALELHKEDSALII